MELETLTPEQEHQNVWNEVAAESRDEFPVVKPEPVAEKAAPEPAKEAPKVEDIIATSMAKLEEKLNGQFRQLNGQFGGLKSEQLKMQEALQTAAAKAAQQVAEAPTEAQQKDAMNDPEEWQRLREAYPDWGDATEKLINSRLAAVKPAIDSAQIEKLVQERIAGQTAEVRSEIITSSLDAVFPGWLDEVKTETFSKWIESQTPEIQALQMSTKVGDAAKMLRLYEQAKDTSPNANLTAQRKKTLSQAVALPKGEKAIPQKSPDDMSPSELWDYEARQSEKRRAQRGY